MNLNRQKQEQACLREPGLEQQDTRPASNWKIVFHLSSIPARLKGFALKMPVDRDSTQLAELTAGRLEVGGSNAEAEAEAYEAYSPFEDFPEPWSYSWLGRIFVYNFGGHGLYIGPHWYCSVLMLGFILAIGLFHCTSVTSLGQLAGGLLVTTLSAASFLRQTLTNHSLPLSFPSLPAHRGDLPIDPRCALANPGVLQKNQAPSLSDSLATRVRRCEICQIFQPRGGTLV